MPRRTLPLLTLFCALAATVGLWTGRASAHVSAIGYGHIRLDGDTVTWSLLLDPWHLETFMSLDADDDAEITSQEVIARADEIAELIVPNLEAMDQSDAIHGTPTVGELRIVTMDETELRGEGFTDLMDFPLVDVPVEFEFPRAVAPEDLVVSYGLFLQSGFGDHWNTARIEYGDESHTVRFTAEQPAFSQESARANDLAAGSPNSDAAAATARGAASTPGNGAGGLGVPAVLFFVVGVALAAVLYVLQRRRGRARSVPAKPANPTTPVSNRRATAVGPSSRSQR